MKNQLLLQGGIRHILGYFGLYYLVLQFAGSDFIANSQLNENGNIFEWIGSILVTMLYSFSKVGTIGHILIGFFFGAVIGFFFEMIIDKKINKGQAIIKNSSFSISDILWSSAGAMLAGLLFHLLGNTFFMVFVSVLLMALAYFDRKMDIVANWTRDA